MKLGRSKKSSPNKADDSATNVTPTSSMNFSTSTSSNKSSTVTKSKSETVNYLLLYEAMVRHQDLEFDATHDHIALTMGRIQYLGRKSSAGSGNNSPELIDEEADSSGTPNGMLTYLQMRRCLLRLGYTWNRSLPSNNLNGSSSNAPDIYDDDVSVMSTNSASTFISGGASANTGSTNNSTRDIIATDAQLIMLLTTLVEMEERHRAMKLMEDKENANHDDDPLDNEEEAFALGLFLPEFIQAYKLIIGGMQSLQTYPSPDQAKVDEYSFTKACNELGLVDKTSLLELRNRSRERTLGLLRLFGPNSKLYKEDQYENVVNVKSLQSAGESPTGPGHKNRGDGLVLSPDSPRKTASKGKAGRPAQIAKDGLLPRLTEEEIRKMVHSKDRALARILEEHESEMNVMAINMEELRLKSLATKRLLKKRRKRTRTAAIVGLIVLLCGGGYYEYHKREQVKVEIKTGRELERMADVKTIAKLKSDISDLTSKLNDAEATIRYEESRYEDIKKKYTRVSKTLEETEGKWLLDQRELEVCRVQRKELDMDLTSVKSRNGETEEEVTWCRERLASTERALEGMERALKKSALDTSGTETKSGLKAIGYPDGDVNNKSKRKKHKPVQMEMKYNKSFRNAVILRQVYSVVGGVLASIVGSALFPGIAKVIGLLVV